MTPLAQTTTAPVNPLKEAEFQKKLLRLNALIPAVMLGFDWLRGNLGANPPEAFIRTTGVVAIIFLILTLLVTPLSQISKWSWLVKHRRWLGLWSFYYGCLHLFGYSFFDRGFNFSLIFADINKRPFILLGFVGFILMAPLAITSTNEMIRRLGGKRWKNLHRLVYVIPILVAIHYWMIVKSDIFYPGLVVACFTLLLGYRVVKKLRPGS